MKNLAFLKTLIQVKVNKSAVICFQQICRYPYRKISILHAVVTVHELWNYSFQLTKVVILSFFLALKTSLPEEERNGDEKAERNNHHIIIIEWRQKLFYIGSWTNPKLSWVFTGN